MSVQRLDVLLLETVSVHRCADLEGLLNDTFLNDMLAAIIPGREGGRYTDNITFQESTERAAAPWRRNQTCVVGTGTVPSKLGSAGLPADEPGIPIHTKPVADKERSCEGRVGFIPACMCSLVEHAARSHLPHVCASASCDRLWNYFAF